MIRMAFLERVLLIGVLVFVAALLAESFKVRPPARTFPLAVTGFTIGLLALSLFQSLHRPMKGRFAEARGLGTLLSFAGLLLAYVAGLSVNFLAATCVFLFTGYLLLMPKRTPKRILFAALLAIAMSGFTWLCFSVWLGVNLPE